MYEKKSLCVDIFVTTHFRTAVIALGIYFQKYIKKNPLHLAVNDLKTKTTVTEAYYKSI